MAELRLRNLRKAYDRGTILAVDDLSLDIPDGGFVTVVGPSGCGKSTTLRMIAGLETPTSGRIYIGDQDVTDHSARKRDVAMVFQNYALYPHKTVEQNMEFGLRMRTDLSKEERSEKVHWAAEMMGIENLLSQKPDELSGGQKQRVALGRAIVRDPDVFLFDEPLSNLDAKLRTTMRTEIQRLQSELGTTSVYVTHDQEEAMTMGDRIVILNDGKLQQQGAPTEVYDNPVNKFVAGFIGSPSMNFIRVTVIGDEDGVILNGTDTEFRYLLSSSTSDKVREKLSLENLEEVTFTLGVRPENIAIADPSDANTLTSTVDVVEPVGSDIYLYLSIAPNFIARVGSDVKIAPGDTIDIKLNESNIHLFDTNGDSVFVDEREQKSPASAA